VGGELGIKSQGYPELLRQTGAQSPLSGPFWGLSTVVVPVSLVGNSTIISQVPGAMPLANWQSDGIIAAPVAARILATTTILERGYHAIRMTGFGSNAGAVSFVRINYHIFNGDTFAITQVERMVEVQFNTAKEFDRTIIFECPQDGIFSLQIRNETLVAASTCQGTVRWKFLGREFQT